MEDKKIIENIIRLTLYLYFTGLSFENALRGGVNGYSEFKKF